MTESTTIDKKKLFLTIIHAFLLSGDFLKITERILIVKPKPELGRE